MRRPRRVSCAYLGEGAKEREKTRARRVRNRAVATGDGGPRRAATRSPASTARRCRFDFRPVIATDAL